MLAIIVWMNVLSLTIVDPYALHAQSLSRHFTMYICLMFQLIEQNFDLRQQRPSYMNSIYITAQYHLLKSDSLNIS